jgi:hypothetical protein
MSRARTLSLMLTPTLTLSQTPTLSRPRTPSLPTAPAACVYLSTLKSVALTWSSFAATTASTAST